VQSLDFVIAVSRLIREQESENIPMMWGYDFGWGWLLMSFGMVLWIALLVVLAWAIIRWLTMKTTVAPPQESATPVGGPSALEILR